jgi:predicted dehydrogenase
MHHTNRRDFLKTGAWAGLGAYLAQSPVFSQQANEKINFAFVGANGQGGSNLGNVARHPLANIVALCDIDETRLNQNATKHPGATKYSDWRRLLEQPDIDAVVCSTPDHSHTVVSVNAMRLGKHVYCEKPLTHSVWEARMMTETAAANPRLATQMGNHGHSNHNMRRIIEIIQSGAIGNVTDVHCWTNRPIWPQGIERPTDTPPCPDTINWDVWLGPAPERPYHPAYHPFKWRGWWDFGTGALGDMACHIMDAPFWSLKFGYPVSVEAEGAEPKMPETAPKWMVVRYKFPQRGDLPACNFTWYDGGKLPPAELFQGEQVRNGGVLMIGDRGTMYIPHDYGGVHVLLPREKFADYKAPDPVLPNPSGHHAEWIEAIKTGTQAFSNFAYAGPFTETVLLGNLAYRAGKKIEWDGPNMRARNAPEIAALVRPEFRKGWSL